MGTSLQSDVSTYSDSDWTCEKETRTSSIAGVAVIGNSMLRAWTHKQRIIVRSSAEATLNAAALRASKWRGIASMMCDFGFLLKHVVLIDSKATEHVLHRQGIDRPIVGARRSQMKQTGNVTQSGSTIIARRAEPVGYITIEQSLRKREHMNCSAVCRSTDEEGASQSLQSAGQCGRNRR